MINEIIIKLDIEQAKCLENEFLERVKELQELNDPKWHGCTIEAMKSFMEQVSNKVSDNQKCVDVSEQPYLFTLIEMIDGMETVSKRLAFIHPDKKTEKAMELCIDESRDWCFSQDDYEEIKQQNSWDEKRLTLFGNTSNIICREVKAISHCEADVFRIAESI